MLVFPSCPSRFFAFYSLAIRPYSTRSVWVWQPYYFADFANTSNSATGTGQRAGIEPAFEKTTLRDFTFSPPLQAVKPAWAVCLPFHHLRHVPPLASNGGKGIIHHFCVFDSKRGCTLHSLRFGMKNCAASSKIVRCFNFIK